MDNMALGRFTLSQIIQKVDLHRFRSRGRRLEHEYS